eukprot:CAMPEP_0172016384 /NCGR_PEP_ID=MMETSP1041-20130122/10991_1 /TAXON_ID=464988 /ORGANISM="Hemiselmis andersenii, Strain CCMP439" /LENGTH=83 /DNA_ID=CAMNT_0012671321 /DNA_START=441 /DNA_END=692 /DNA_ORIENTATION=+
MNPPPLDLHSSGSTNTIMQGRPSPYASCSSTGTISKTELAAMTPTPTPRYTVQPSSGMQARSSQDIPRGSETRREALQKRATL